MSDESGKIHPRFAFIRTPFGLFVTGTPILAVVYFVLHFLGMLGMTVTTAKNDPPVKGNTGSIEIQLFRPQPVSGEPGESVRWPAKVDPASGSDAHSMCLTGFNGITGTQCSYLSYFGNWTVYINDGNPISDQIPSITHGVKICGNSTCATVPQDQHMRIDVTVSTDTLMPPGGAHVTAYPDYVTYEFHDSDSNCDSHCVLSSVYFTAPGQKIPSGMYTCPQSAMCIVSLGKMNAIPTMTKRWFPEL